MVSRRDLLRSTAGASLVGVIGGITNITSLSKAKAAEGKASDQGQAFDQTTVRQLAKAMAQRAYKAPDDHLPDAINKLDFDGFRGITFRHEKALWYGENLNFAVEFFPRGFLYRPRLDIYEVIDGIAKPVTYQSDMFTYADPKHKVDQDLGFSGLKLLTKLNQADSMEEFAVFLGASYFRAIAKGQQYGLSARGFAKGTADPQGEEFPLFRSFWIVKPKTGIESLVIYALLDSPSLTGAYRFTIRPGSMTIFDVESYLYPRKTISNGGIAPLTGMFYFDANDRNHVDDWRPAAHDSEGLLLWTGAGQQIWRPLTNPVDLQYSVFTDDALKGFGLMQRKHAFSQYEDLSLHYELRPSAWVEPVGEWQAGSVNLVEIPTPSEVNDNIVAFWRPKESLKNGKEYSFTYRLYWGWDNPWTTPLARVAATRMGAVVDKPDVRFINIDFFDGPLNGYSADKQLHVNVSSSVGKITNVTMYSDPALHKWRTTFEFDPQGAKSAELQCVLMDGDQVVSEQWAYRWTP